MAAQVASATSLNSSPPSELKKADRDPKEESVPAEKQQENKEPGSEIGSPGRGELHERPEPGNATGGGGGGGESEMKNGNGNPPRLTNNQNDPAGPEANNHPGMAHQHHGSGFPPPSYGYAHHYARGPFHQHGGQQSPGMAPVLPGAVIEPYPGNSHDHGFPNHYNNYGPFPNRTQYQGQGFGMSSPRTNTAGQPAKQPAAGTLMAGAFNNQRYNMSNPQPSPTPTLNQLLTSPSASRGYPGYPQGDYSSPDGPGKGPGDMGSTNHYAAPWQQRGHHAPPMSPGNAPHALNRNQVNFVALQLPLLPPVRCARARRARHRAAIVSLSLL